MTVHAAPGAPPLALAPATDEDFEALLALRMAAMHESLQQLGRFDPQRARERLSRAFEPVHSRNILQGGERVGFVVLLPVPARHPDHLVLDHLYIAPQAQGQGVGSWVMAQVLAEADRLGACRAWGVDSENRPQRAQFLPDLQPHSLVMGQRDGEKWTAAVDSQPTLPKPDRLLGLAVRVTALKLSDANRFYQRHGFELQHASEWDLHYVRPAGADQGGSQGGDHAR